MEPFFFGLPEKPLFGVYHPPQCDSVRDCGIVLCYPIGHEYLHIHRAYRQLAIHLSNAGFHVLRFDFYGCGDSSGDEGVAGLYQCLSDISVAIDEIRSRCGFVRFCLAGYRLGGTLAVMAGAERGGIEGLVLWDGIVSGKGYIEELTILHRRFLRDYFPKPQRLPKHERLTELKGFPLTDCMYTDLEKMNLLAIQQKPADNLLVIGSKKTIDERGLRDHLKSLGVHSDYQHIPCPGGWLVQYQVVPIQVVQTVVRWVSEVFR
jgi:pimeloyl-ACP methyl ester carboxylesterase